MLNKTVSEFSELLSEKVSVPGGGSASALVGAYAAALCSMSANFTSGKKKFAMYQDDIDKIIYESNLIRENLLNLVTEDIQNFEPLSKAYSIDKNDPKRDEILEEATKNALFAPLKMMEQIVRSIDLLLLLEDKCSAIMISDVGCGAYMAAAALKSASLNVFVNTKSLKNREYAKNINEKTLNMLEYADKAMILGNRILMRLGEQDLKG